MTPGTIITSQGTRNPFVLHKAVVVQLDTGLHVLHNTSSRGPSCEPLSDYFAKGRDILWSEPSGLSSARLLKRHDHLKQIPYDALTFNCEHYIHLLTTDDYYSPQIRFWSWMAATLIVIIAGAWWFRSFQRS